mgnify:CR=1 FL=1
MNLNAWVSRAEAAFIAGVSAGTVGKWRARGWVDQAGLRRSLQVRQVAGGRMRYRLGDVLEAERDTFLSRKGHRSQSVA